YECEVHYKGISDVFSFGGHDNRTVLVFDVERLGVGRLDMQVGIVDWNTMNQVEVACSYGSGPEPPERGFWCHRTSKRRGRAEDVGKPVKEPRVYKVTWIDKNLQRFEQHEEQTTSGNIVLDMPITGFLEVTVVPAGNFGGGGLIARVDVTIVYTDKANDYD